MGKGANSVTKFFLKMRSFTVTNQKCSESPTDLYHTAEKCYHASAVTRGVLSTAILLVKRDYKHSPVVMIHPDWPVMLIIRHDLIFMDSGDSPPVMIEHDAFKTKKRKQPQASIGSLLTPLFINSYYMRSATHVLFTEISVLP